MRGDAGGPVPVTPAPGFPFPCSADEYRRLGLRDAVRVLRDRLSLALAAWEEVDRMDPYSGHDEDISLGDMTEDEVRAFAEAQGPTRMSY